MTAKAKGDTMRKVVEDLAKQYGNPFFCTWCGHPDWNIRRYSHHAKDCLVIRARRLVRSC